MIDQGMDTRGRKPLFHHFHWGVFAGSEGIFKLIQLSLLWFIGTTAAVSSTVLSGMFLVGLIQIVGGLVVNRRSRYEVLPGRGYIAGALLVGLTATYIIIVSVLIFTDISADLTVVAFLVASTLVVGGLIGKYRIDSSFFSKGALTLALLIFSLFAFLGFPSLSEIVSFETWVWLAFTLPVAAILSEFVTRKFHVNTVSPWVNNFWMGCSLTVVSGVALLYTNSFNALPSLVGEVPGRHWFLFVFLGLAMLSTLFVHQRTYMYGGSMAFKKLTMTSVYLAGALLFGFLFVGNVVIVGKLIGVILFIAAYLVLEPSVLKLIGTSKTHDKHIV